jgi:glycosyltransferase involved in cell wall biosynthesis
MATQAQVLLVPSTSKKYGGDLYEAEVGEALREACEVKTEQVIPSAAKMNRVLALPMYFMNIWRLRAAPVDVIIRSMNNCFFLPRTIKNIVIAFHYDTAFCHPLVKVHHWLTLMAMVRQRKKIDRLVVISEYWKEFFRRYGFEKIDIVYSAVNPAEFVVAPEELAAFRQKYRLTGPNLIYIGNPQRKKGALEVYEALKDSGYKLVASGNADVEIPVRTLKLDFREYVMLLHSVDLVITMSQFNEGWCRQAHEAMLCSKPVIGSGRGGMRELLDAGGQIVCENFSDLPRLVKTALGNRELGKKGREAALKYTYAEFTQKWRDVVAKVVESNARMD